MVKSIKTTTKKVTTLTQSKENCLTGVCSPRAQRASIPTPKKGKHFLLLIKGPGLFLTSHITKMGGTNGFTWVKIDIDGKSIFNESYHSLERGGYTHQNPSGIVLLKESSFESNLTIGFPFPLRFEKHLEITVNVKENNVNNIIGRVFVGK